MINELKATVTFVTPTKTINLKVAFNPQPGITAVVGRNGSGKSWSVLEVPRFLLFGKKALRGLASDYVKQDARGVFTIKGERYTIERSPKRERISDASGTVLGVGAEAVTAKVVELLGYGLDVFDLCNASVQKETDRFGKLRPAQRKELIDRVVGLTAYETVEKACKAEALGFKREAEGLTKALRAPGEAPVKPANYFPPHIIEITIKRERQKLADYRRLSGMIYRGMPPLQPIMPRTDATELRHIEADEYERAQMDKIIKNRMMAPVQEMPAHILEAARARLAAVQAVEARGPAPTVSREHLALLQDQWNDYDYAMRQSDELAICPKCATTFRTGGEVPPEPGYTKEGVAQELQRWAKWGDGADIPIPAGPDMTAEQIKQQEAINAFAQEYRDAEAVLKALPVLPKGTLDAMRGAITAWAVYDEQMKVHDTKTAESRVAQIELDELEGDTLSDDDLDQLQTDLSDARLYDATVERHAADVKVFDEAVAEIERVSKLAEQFKEGAEAINGARTTLKAHLAPLLSRVASSLIYDMTAGALSSVVVDEDMEITVDGQRIETLSGAGETVANLALRIGLGQVLVKDTFPVFLGDEIDSDADDQRREATKLAIKSLGSKLDQIILVSHRQIDIADHILDLDVT